MGESAPQYEVSVEMLKRLANSAGGGVKVRPCVIAKNR